MPHCCRLIRPRTEQYYRMYWMRWPHGTLPILSGFERRIQLQKGYSSKKYLFDTGVANFLLTRLFPVNPTGSDPSASMLLENAVLQDCISFVQSVKAVQCYRSNNRVSTELDFVVQCSKRLMPIEVKSSSSVKSNTLSQLLDFLNRMDLSEGYVVYTGLPETRVIRNKRIRLIPPYLVTLLMQDQLRFE